MLRIRAFSDYLSVACQEDVLLWENFEDFTESSDRDKFTCAAVWRSQGKQTLKEETSENTVRADVYEMGGQIQAVFGGALLKGRYFSSDEDGVCLIDQKSAEQLFGSRNVLDQEVRIGEETYRISGILDGSRRACVIPSEEGAFEGIAVRKQDAEQSSDNAAAVLSSYFGGVEGTVTDGQLHYIVLLLKIAFLVLTAAVLTSVVLIKVMGKRLAGGAVIAVGLAVLIVIVREVPLGSDYLPTYWSDFEFFGRLWEKIAGQIFLDKIG